MKYSISLSAVCLLLCWSCSNTQQVADTQAVLSTEVDSFIGTADHSQVTLSTYVDPFIGTADHGHVYPGATVPFGMVQLSPDNGTPGWDWCSGYNWIDSVIVGFSHTHLSGTGIGDLADVLFMPTTESVDLSIQPKSRDEYSYASAFSHEQESAEPGYYAVKLQDTDIQVELTTSTRVGFHRYTFPESKTASIVLDLSYALNWDAPTASFIQVENDSTLSGYRHSTGWAKDQRVYFVAQFSRPFSNYSGFSEFVQQTATDTFSGKHISIRLGYETTVNEVIQVKVGLSTADIEGARASLAEIPHWDFDQARADASQAWNEELSLITVRSDRETPKTIFYTALYHSQIAPVMYSDPNGNYKGADNQVHQAKGFTKYGIFSLWDTFRAANPLFTITQGNRVNDMVRSLLAHYREYGLLPVWSLLGNETNTMTGYHAIPVITDAYLKGYRDYDAEEAFEAMKKSAMQNIRGTNFLREYGYLPYDNSATPNPDRGQSVTRTLEYSYDDWCIAQMAKALGKDTDYQYFMKRAANFRNLFDESTGFMRAKLADGTWKAPFDPYYSSHDFDIAEYTEGNAWQHSWFVPHDVKGLIDLHGGNEPFITKLDSLFEVSSVVKGENVSVDISGLIGQYAHGNEPSHHIAYLYNYAAAPWKTQETVHRIMREMYTTQPNGLCGNEDCGQMSAWYVFSAMGFYPVNPAEGVYVIGTPMFEESVIRVGSTTSFTIRANGVSDTHFYIQSVTLNGKPLERTFIRHEEVMAGGELIFEMGDQPNKVWGTHPTAAPPSMSGR